MFEITIKNKKKLKDDDYGVTNYVSNKKFVIEVSLSRNPDLAEYGSTLLHELLHAWLGILKLNGAKFNSRNEHKFIYKVEKNITDLLKMLKRKGA